MRTFLRMSRKDWMPLTWASTYLDCTPDNLRGAIARGSLSARKVGRDWWVTKDEVERYGRENRRAVSPDRRTTPT